MSAVFADTYYFLGLVNPEDAAHARCQQFSNEYRGRIVTTAAILLELADALAEPPNRQTAAGFIRSLPDQPGVEVVQLTPVLLDRALAMFEDYADKEWSWTDCISFLVMQDRELTQAATGDHHFEQAGFVILLK